MHSTPQIGNQENQLQDTGKKVPSSSQLLNYRKQVLYWKNEKK